MQRGWASCGGREPLQPQPHPLTARSSGDEVWASQEVRQGGRRPEDLSSGRFCVLACLSHNTMAMPVRFKSRVRAMWVEEPELGQLRQGISQQGGRRSQVQS